ncbi:MAG TPA: ankyrin repeat domain-containing protein [Zeimonas sp.]
MRTPERVPRAADPAVLADSAVARGRLARVIVDAACMVAALVVCLSFAPRDALAQARSRAVDGGTPAAAASARPAPGASREFWEAIARDDVERVQTLLLRGTDTNALHPQFGPAIVFAARERSWNVVRELANIVGTRVDVPNARGETAAMLAALQGNLEIVRLLVDKGAEVNRPGWTPLHYAAVSGNVDLLRYLLERNAYIDAQSPNRSTPLMMSARHDRVDAARMLVEAGADPTPHNDAGLDAADYLARNGKPDDAKWMRERAAVFARRYGTLERPRTAESIAEERQRRQRLEGPRLPGSRD